jgi:ABC-type uncharacterized transport system substrate-binding protein
MSPIFTEKKNSFPQVRSLHQLSRKKSPLLWWGLFSIPFAAIRVIFLLALISLSVALSKASAQDKVILYVGPGLVPFREQFIRVENQLRNRVNAAFDMKFLEIPLNTHEMSDKNLNAIISSIAEARPFAIVTPNLDIAKLVVQKNTSIQVVVSTLADPVALGIVGSMADQRIDITGYSHHVDLDEKRLSMLKDISPKSKRIGILLDRTIKTERMARSGGQLEFAINNATILPFEVNSLSEALAVIMQSKTRQIDAWYICHMPINYDPRDARQLVDSVNRQRLPAIYETMRFVEAGGLASYEQVLFEPEGIWIRDLQLILEGVRARDIPFERPRHFFFAINTAEARRLELNISTSLLKQVDITFPCNLKPPSSCIHRSPRR